MDPEREIEPCEHEWISKPTFTDNGELDEEIMVCKKCGEV